MNREEVQNIGWNFTLFPGQTFKDHFGGALLQYAQGNMNWGIWCPRLWRTGKRKAPAVNLNLSGKGFCLSRRKAADKKHFSKRAAAFSFPVKRERVHPIPICQERAYAKKLTKIFCGFALPTLAAFVIAFLIPFLFGLYLSFTNFTTVTNTQWVGWMGELRPRVYRQQRFPPCALDYGGLHGGIGAFGQSAGLWTGASFDQGTEGY